MPSSCATVPRQTGRGSPSWQILPPRDRPKLGHGLGRAPLGVRRGGRRRPDTWTGVGPWGGATPLASRWLGRPVLMGLPGATGQDHAHAADVTGVDPWPMSGPMEPGHEHVMRRSFGGSGGPPASASRSPVPEASRRGDRNGDHLARYEASMANGCSVSPSLCGPQDRANPAHPDPQRATR